MELFPGEAAEMAIESGVVPDMEAVHSGWPTLGYYQREGDGGGLVVNAGVTDWACGLQRDPVIQGITLNIIRKLSGGDAAVGVSSSSGGGSATTSTVVTHPDGTSVQVTTTTTQGGPSL